LQKRSVWSCGGAIHGGGEEFPIQRRHHFHLAGLELLLHGSAIKVRMSAQV